MVAEQGNGTTFKQYLHNGRPQTSVDKEGLKKYRMNRIVFAPGVYHDDKGKKTGDISGWKATHIEGADDINHAGDHILRIFPPRAFNQGLFQPCEKWEAESLLSRIYLKVTDSTLSTKIKLNALRDVGPPSSHTRKPKKRPSDDNPIEEKDQKEVSPPPVNHFELRNQLTGSNLGNLAYRGFLENLTEDQTTKILDPGLMHLARDQADWTYESSKMHEVYANCNVMLSADRPVDGHAGLFSQDMIASWQPDADDWSRSGVRARISKIHAVTATNADAIGSKELSPLKYRAWAFQERLLAPRILHYAYDEVVWECKASVGCQYGNSKTPVWFQPTSKELCSLNEKAGLWHSLVQQYSRMDLTNFTDILPALVGLPNNSFHNSKLQQPPILRLMVKFLLLKAQGCRSTCSIGGNM
ncbi:hypothetical protein IFR05_004121 [Cadophora sp. M221]|nr:hypothetical protein IFR05_004121 [Cadophora sp. M221]